MERAEVSKFWLEFCGKGGVVPTTPYQVWYFGNRSDQARELAELVIAGTKTATASLFDANILEPEKAPVDEGYSVVTSFEGEPMCVIQTTEIRHLPFYAVDEAFAYDEGEDDRTLSSWRDGHWVYFTAEAAELGLGFDKDSMICCERFRLLYPL
jgi:uncharacterized protein YhfF